MPFLVLLIEDEYPARMLMMDFVLRCPELQLGGVAENAEKARELLASKEFDIVFLDIQLPDRTGLEILKEFRSKSINKIPFFVFTTAYSEFAVNAFDMDAVDYLLKPFSFERFRKSVEKVISLPPKSIVSENKEGNLRFFSDQATYLLPYLEIVYLSAHNKSTVIHSIDKEYSSFRLLKEFEEDLPNSLFVRIHKSYLVNVTFVSNIRYDKGGAYLIQLKNEDETMLPVGRTYAPVLKVKLGLS